MIRTQEGRRRKKDFFIKYFTSHFICKFRKGCSKFACERELETEHNWNILTPKLWPSELCLSRSPWLLNRNSGVHSPVCWLFLLHRVLSVCNYIACPQLYSPVCVPLSSIRRPFITFKLPRSDMDTPPRLLPISGDRDVSLPLSLEWPVWSSSSGNNCHPVQRSLSSGASAYESIMGFFLPRPISSANFRPRDFLS